MTLHQQEQFFSAFTERQKDIMLRKGNDYAGADRLSNFKKVAAMLNVSPEQACLSLIATKVARLGELFSGKEPSNESVDDSIIDLANYTALLGMIRAEKISTK